MDKRREFGKWIQAIREEKGLTKRQVSRLLGYKSTGTIHTVEQGINPLPVEQIHPLARTYSLDVSVILEKIRECEPELYQKYVTLQRDIIGYFTAKVSRLAPMSDNARNVNLDETRYIMSTKSGLMPDFLFMTAQEPPGQEIFRFPDPQPQYLLFDDFKPRNERFLH